MMPNYRLATRRAAIRHGVDPGVLERLVQQESGFNPNAKSPAGAQGIAQFMPGTAPQYGVKLGDGRVGDDLDGAARMIRQALDKNGGDYKKALSVYNSGRPDGYLHIAETRNYVKTILGGGGGPSAPTAARSAYTGAMARKASAPAPALPTGPPVTPTGLTRPDLLQQYLAMRGRPGATVALATGLGDLKAPTLPQQAGLPSKATPLSAAAGGGTGTFKITGANPGRLRKPIVQFAERVAGIYGQPLTGDSGATHSKMTTDGNVSDHWAGNATDIPATGKQLIAMGQAALEAAGMSRAKARKQTGGLYNVNGHQIIFNTYLGGDHTNHLHISAK